MNKGKLEERLKEISPYYFYKIIDVINEAKKEFPKAKTTEDNTWRWKYYDDLEIENWFEKWFGDPDE